MIWWILAATVFILLFGLGIIAGGAPFVPTRKKWIKDAMVLANIKPSDIVVDLGSGDGSVLMAAIESGAQAAIGYEISPLLVIWSRFRLRKLSNKVTIIDKNFFNVDLPKEITVVYMFQATRALKGVKAYFESQKLHLQTDKLRIVCFGFEIPGCKAVGERGGMMLYEF